MDFQNVPPVDIKVHDLSLSLESPPSILEKLQLVRGLVVEEKRILQNVSLDLPARSLIAIIGESGSGKVCVVLWMMLIN